MHQPFLVYVTSGLLMECLAKTNLTKQGNLNNNCAYSATLGCQETLVTQIKL